ncbi:TRAP transporter substrate-binding protein [Hydrogenophaga sp.]|uniref:TRAP transporter substrate-binding protein n=1 Tax=Hydrogenophaga sp. TaxID=1904254 RepID=UPI00261D88CC|nr:TRAP transporter substrate-binding protein [Hydrogenophaga sp.]MCW5654245.1 TRAP transporter substrate-binding protein [Hydrogenophaga sp.]
MLDRRTLIKAAAASVAAPALPALAQNVTTLRVHTFVPATSNVWSRVIVPWMKKMETESGGRLKFEGYASMQLGGTPPQLFDQARDGVVDMAWSLAGYTPGRFPRSEVFELPFFTYDGEGSSKAAWEYLTTQAADEFKEVKVLAFHTHGLNILHNKRRAVTKAADLRGLKMRGPTRIATQILSAVGATPVGMPLPQIPDALSKGVIDGAILPWDTVPAGKLDQLTNFHTEFAKGMPGFNNSIQFMVMNRARYDSLPPDLQKVIDNNAGLETSGMYGRVIAEYDPVVRKAVVDRGNTVSVMGRAETEEFIKLCDPIVSQWVDDMNRKGLDGKKLLDAGRSLIQKYRPKA